MPQDNFDRLDELVQGLLESNSTFEAENKKLVSLLKVKNSELEWLKERLSTLDKEKGLVKAKVDGLLESIDSII